MKKAGLFVLSAVIFMASCKKDNTNNQTVVLPDTYNFSNVNYSGQTNRINMLTAIVNEMKKGLTQDLSYTTLYNMYSNTGNPFSNDTLNSSGDQLRDETFSADIAAFDSYFQRITDVSLLRANAVTGPGQAGTATSIVDNTKKYLVDSNGVEYAQVIQKGLMGAVFYYRIVEDETAKSNLDAADNATVIPGEGTQMEHEWDEGFGYWGVPTTFRAAAYDSFNTAKKLLFYGTYVSKGISIDLINKTLKAFIQGREAIGRKDYVTRDAATIAVAKNFELINACAYISYLNQAIAGFSDYAVRCHTLSEGFGFFNALKYNSTKLISQSDFDDIAADYYVNGKLSISQFTSPQLTTLRDRISTIYGLDAIKATL